MPLTNRIGLLLAALLLAACTAPAAPATATPTPLGTFTPPTATTAATVTDTPAARERCVFAVTLPEPLGVVQAGVYWLLWQGTPLTVNTLAGPLQVTGGVGMTAGPRVLLLSHSAALPDTMTLHDSATPGSTVMLEPTLGLYAVHDASGAPRYQRVSDDTGDTRGMPDKLDITQAERIFGAGDDFVLRVWLAAPDDGRYIWQFESIDAVLGVERYSARTLSDGSVLGLYTPASGEVRDFDGTLVRQGPTTTWAFTVGGALPFAARSRSSAADVDETAVYSPRLMNTLYAAASQFCGIAANDR